MRGRRGVECCSIEGCDRDAYGWGWCEKHYQRWRLKGTTSLTFQRERPPGETSTDMVPVVCRDCSSQFSKIRNSLFRWSGRCKSCASKELATRPEIKAIHRATGLLVIARGKLPTAPPENRRYGAKNNKWRAGVTPLALKIRHSPEALSWRKVIFERDNYTCQGCGTRGCFLNADHIKPFALHPELRFNPGNGRTLCRPCHKTYGAKVFHGRLVRETSFPGPLPDRDVSAIS